MAVSSDEKNIAFSSRDTDRAFSRLFNIRLTRNSKFQNLVEYSSPFVIKKKDSCFSDLNFDMKIGGYPILTAFQYSNLNIYIFAFYKGNFELMSIIVPDCVGRICRSSAYKNKLMAMDSESKLITLTFENQSDEILANGVVEEDDIQNIRAYSSMIHLEGAGQLNLDQEEDDENEHGMNVSGEFRSLNF